MAANELAISREAIAAASKIGVISRDFPDER